MYLGTMADGRCDVDVEMVMHGSAGYQVRIETRSIMSCDQAWIPNARPDIDMPGSEAHGSDSVGALVCNQPHNTARWHQIEALVTIHTKHQRQ
jgi:hypothetical protein